jgi:hypothetical protein
MLLLNQDFLVSGNLMPVNFRNPSPEQFNLVFLSQPLDQSIVSQSLEILGVNPSKQLHTGELLMLQVAYAPQSA